MDINILKLASDTKNNKYIRNCTHSTKFKSQICGDEIEIFLIIKDNMIKDFTYQSQSCIYMAKGVCLCAAVPLKTITPKRRGYEKSIPPGMTPGMTPGVIMGPCIWSLTPGKSTPLCRCASDDDNDDDDVDDVLRRYIPHMSQKVYKICRRRNICVFHKMTFPSLV